VWLWSEVAMVTLAVSTSTLLTTLITTIYWVVSSIVFYIAFNRTLWRGRRGWVFIGVGYMLLAIVIQSMLQSIPAMLIVIKALPSILSARSISETNALMLNLLKPYALWLSLYAGFMAGLCQEVARYFAVKDREPASALYVGYGFALIDIAVGILNSLVGVLAYSYIESLTPFAPHGLPDILLYAQYVGIAIQPIISFLFHPGASMFLRYMQAIRHGLTGLTINIAAHTYIDSFLLYLNNALLLGLITNMSTVTALLAIYFTTIITTAIVLFLMGLNRIRLLH
jgi:hypothetical protein